MATWNGTAEVLKIRTDLRNIPAGAYTVADSGGKFIVAPITPWFWSEPMIRLFDILFLLMLGLLPLRPQERQTAQDMLDHALHLADLYNWDDAGKDFAEAEKLFLAAGDQRNALYAKLGRIRSTVDQRALPTTAAQLASELDNNPLLQTDKQLRLFCLDRER